MPEVILQVLYHNGKVGYVPKSIVDLVQSLAKAVMNEQDLLDVMYFGKYKGMLIGTMIENDPRYVQWAVDNVDHFNLNEAALAYLKENL